MAEAILYSLAAELLKSLGSQAVQAVASAWGFEAELRSLVATTNTIKHVLLDAEEKQVVDPLVKHWLKRLKAVMYEVEDLLEEFVALSASWEEGKSFAARASASWEEGNQARGISMRIKEIRKKLDEIGRDRQLFVFRECVDAPDWVRRRREYDSHSLVDEKEVIGRDDDKQIIMDKLFASDVEGQEVSVVCIEGMGGLGKTALAKLVFNDSAVREQFGMRLWVCVAEEFGLKTIIQRVLKSAAPDEPCNDLEMDQLCCRLQEKLRGKRYLLVLDDVWNENREEWLNVRRLLGTSGDGSKILVTTRLPRVADIMVDGSARHKLEGLSAEESWSLFEKLAFKRGQERNARLVELGKDIVKKCGGVPLAIRALASYLYARDEGKWLSVKDKELSQIEGEVADTMEVLKLSYRHLWSPLKQCFAYCSVFPKDTGMEKVTLINLWMAQGFILFSDDQSLEETGEEYFTELVQRCFFQDIERDEWSNILYCKMHDLMHDLAQQVSEGEIVSAIKGRTTLEKGVSHVSFDFFFAVPSEIPTSLMSLRTLIFHASTSDQETSDQERSDQERSGQVFSALLSSLKSLRVLELKRARIRSMPRSIGKLVHVRYLCLSWSSIETLPDSIGNLLNLQTLKLTWSELKVLPSVIERLTSLRHLNPSYSDELIRMAADISKLTNLRHLEWLQEVDPRGCRHLKFDQP